MSSLPSLPHCRGNMPRTPSISQSTGCCCLIRKQSSAAVYRILALIIASFMSLAASATAAEPVDVYVFAGQSNAAGFGMGKETLPPELQTTFKKVQMWTPAAKNREGAFLPLQPGVNSNHPNAMWAVESPLALRLENDPKQSAPVFFIKSAIGGTPLEPQPNGKDWHPAKGGYYGGLREAIRRSIAAIKAAGYEPRFRAFIWNQGEAEIGAGPAVAAKYGIWLKDLIVAMRKDTGTPELDVVVIRISPDHRRNDPANGIVTFEQGRVAASDDHVFLVDNHYELLPDHTHLSVNAYRSIADDILAVLNGRYPRTPPEIVPGQKLSLPADSANGAWAGMVKLSNKPKPDVRWSVSSPEFAIDPFTGRLTVADETKLETPQTFSVHVIASNGEKDAEADVTVELTQPVAKSADPFDAPSRVILARPQAADSVTIDDGRLTELRDKDWPKTQQKFVALQDKNRFACLPNAFGELTGIGFDEGQNSFIMRLEATTDKVWTVDEADSFVVSTVFRPVSRSRKGGTVWSILNDQRRISFALGYNYAAGRFEIRYKNWINLPTLATAPDNTSPPDTTYVVTVQKTGRNITVRVNGKEVLTCQNARGPVVIKEDGEGLFFWGGVHPNGGELTGTGGPLFIANQPLTLKTCAAIEEQFKAFR
ncbi:MAG TPA: sialate O-acetylesterase [Chthoniobacterales bacterium]